MKKFGWFKFGEHLVICQIDQTFLLYGSAMYLLNARYITSYHTAVSAA